MSMPRCRCRNFQINIIVAVLDTPLIFERVLMKHFCLETLLLMKHCMTLSSRKSPFQIVKHIRKMPSCQALLASSKLNCIFSKKRSLLICFTNIKYTFLSIRQMSKRWIKSFFVSRTATKKINMLPMCNVNEMLNEKVFHVNKKS